MRTHSLFTACPKCGKKIEISRNQVVFDNHGGEIIIFSFCTDCHSGFNSYWVPKENNNHFVKDNKN